MGQSETISKGVAPRTKTAVRGNARVVNAEPKSETVCPVQNLRKSGCCQSPPNRARIGDPFAIAHPESSIYSTPRHDMGSPDLLVIRAELPLEVGPEGQKSASFGPSRRPPGHFPGRLPYPGPSIIKRSGEPGGPGEGWTVWTLSVHAASYQESSIPRCICGRIGQMGEGASLVRDRRWCACLGPAVPFQGVPPRRLPYSRPYHGERSGSPPPRARWTAAPQPASRGRRRARRSSG